MHVANLGLGSMVRGRRSAWTFDRWHSYVEWGWVTATDAAARKIALLEARVAALPVTSAWLLADDLCMSESILRLALLRGKGSLHPTNGRKVDKGAHMEVLHCKALSNLRSHFQSLPVLL